MSVVHQLVLHPALTSSLKVGSTTVGRDKVYRTIQYAARYLAWYCLRKGYTSETVARLTALKSTLALSRKLMRIGKPLEHLQASVKALDISNPFLRYTALGRQLGYAGYLTHDMLAWAQTAKVWTFAPETSQKINRRAATCWMWGIGFSILSGLYKTVELNKRKESVRRSVQNEEKEGERKVTLKSIVAQEKAVRFQLVQDCLDILLPTGTLGYHHLDDGVLGIVGVITSLMGLQTQVHKVLGSSK